MSSSRDTEVTERDERAARLRTELLAWRSKKGPIHAFDLEDMPELQSIYTDWQMRPIYNWFASLGDLYANHWSREFKCCYWSIMAGGDNVAGRLANAELKLGIDERTIRRHSDNSMRQFAGWLIDHTIDHSSPRHSIMFYCLDDDIELTVWSSYPGDGDPPNMFTYEWMGLQEKGHEVEQFWLPELTVAEPVWKRGEGYIRRRVDVKFPYPSSKHRTRLTLRFPGHILPELSVSPINRDPHWLVDFSLWRSQVYIEFTPFELVT